MRTGIPLHLAPLLGLWLTGSASALAALPPAKPDWPCAQRLIPQLTAGAFWSGPAPTADQDWRADQTLAGVVAAVTPRDVSPDEGERMLAAYAESVPRADRPQRLAEAFGALVDETNAERSAIIARIEALARRQRELGDVVARVTDELRAATQDPAGSDADRRTEIVQRREFLIRSVEETQRTMRYACEVPVQLEARLGRYARVLQARF